MKKISLLFAAVMVVCSAFAATTTIEKTMTEIVSENSYTISAGSNVTCYPSIYLNSDVRVLTAGDANCGSFWGTDAQDWRLYQAKKGDIHISVPEGCTLQKVTITYTVTNNGTLKSGTTTIASGAEQTVSGTLVSYTVGNTGTATNGQVRVTKIKVVYDKPGDVVSVTGISLDKTTLSLVVSESATLTETVVPANASNKSVVWTSSDESVATVAAGKVTALAAGSTTITATTEDGSFTASCAVTVAAPQVKTIAEFLAAKGGGCYLVGRVSNIQNTTYGNFDLTDASGTIYVYGCLTPAGAAQQFASLNVAEGDYIKVFASEYKLYGTTEEAVNVVFVEKVDAPTALENVTAEKAVKFVKNGQLYIRKNGVLYNALGSIVEE